ncbi:MAG TPA: hypothetical protein VN282_04245 [Pyrinomonadaceae bacterium]|nr:hypothetical protein [Pyrinomonadaceae bacterium]
MKPYEQIEIVEDLIHSFANELLGNDAVLIDLVARSNCYGWGLDDYQGLRLWDVDEGTIGFAVALYWTGDQDEEAPSPWDGICATVEGEITQENGHWVVTDYKLFDADFDLDYEEDYVEAVTSNVEYYRTFSEEISSLRRLNAVEVPDPRDLRTLRRQTYIGAITCLETYLSDAFINNVLSKEKFLESFFSNYDFGDKKLEMGKLYDYARRVRDIAKSEMLDVMYHNLPKVSNIYKAVLDVEFPKFQAVARAISTRHDLVHRNGKTKDGDDVHIDEEVVAAVIAEVEGFVTEVNRRLEQVISSGAEGATRETEDIDDADIPF